MTSTAAFVERLSERLSVSLLDPADDAAIAKAIRVAADSLPVGRMSLAQDLA